MIATAGSSAKKEAAAAAAMGGKAARACDGCLRRRARWYCAADDAFLCQGCDTSVHSANPLARRHERLRLRPTSPPGAPPLPAKREPRDEVVPAWFKRKARTPRGGHAKSLGQVLSRRLVVPEATGGDSPEGRNGEGEVEEEEEQLLYRVPVFDPALAEFCSPPPLEDAAAVASSCNEDGAVEDPAKPDPAAPDAPPAQLFPDGHANFEPTDAELREFAADMEALLGRGLDDGNEEDSSFYMETLGLLDPVDDDAARVKVEIDGSGTCKTSGTLACGFELEAEASDEMLDIDFDYGSPDQETPQEDEKTGSNDTSADTQFLQTSLSLTLNYEAIIQSWGSSPWTGGGERPHVKLDDSWPHDFTGMWLVGGMVGHGGEELRAPRLGMMDGGREARVSRYREKRRTRLFSKKIRYEVRKLNAKKRPRMKGRFVKRTTAGGNSVAVAGVA
ncbi:zinc finger protein CONSTANS-LIKE 16-like [Panicum miliaceum]|uniref:Zinc finger protein CONSTANS-LIKE 16-like n=1 Tax=Panicum miliaceum TaxID=4540 RepID=A0A3L6PIQ4_PANMI|nr:zinc finger protein CONSTANS-LIKE 16-like [Panicum miliaceum]